MADSDINILIRARDLASKTIGGINQKLGTLDRIGRKAVSGLTTNLTRAGVVAGVTLVGGITAGIRSLVELEKVTNQTKAVIESTGGAAGVTAGDVRKLSEELEGLTTADDKAIESGAQVLLRFGAIGSKVFPRATRAATNMAIALAGGDVEAANFADTAKIVGKALDDPVRGMTALRRVGVTFTADQEKQIKALVKAGKVQKAQALILAELEKRYGKAGEAAAKGAGGAWRRLQDIGEDLSQALARGLLPALTRVSEWLTKKLADPGVQKALEGLGNDLGRLTDQALAFLDKVDFGSIARGLGTARDIAGTVVKMFTSLPPWVQQAVITGWGLNKLTGGALSDLIGALGSGLIKGVLGMNAGVVNINAGVVNGGGGVPGVGGQGGPGLISRVGGAIAGLGAGGILSVAVVAMAPVAAAMLALEVTKNLPDRGREETNRARADYRDKVRRERGMGPANPTGLTPQRLGPSGSTASSARLIPGIGDTRGELTGIRNAIRDQQTVAARAVQIAERSGTSIATKIDTTRSELVGIRQAQERRLAEIAAVERAAAGSTRSELAGIRAAVNATRATIAAKNFSPRIVFSPVTNVRISTSQQNREDTVWRRAGNGSTVGIR